MHETMVAESIRISITAEAEKQNAKPMAATISCGVFNALNDDVLIFAFEAIVKGTICEGMKLIVRHIPIGAECDDCGRTFDFDIANPVCAHCGGKNYKMLPDAPLMLDEIEFDKEDNNVQSRTR
jgi:hydrogenase nickel incorporation protein HypA/HybF